MIGKTEYREAMSRLGTAVNIITTDGAAGLAGVTASAVCSVTDDPPTLLVCINRLSRAHPVFLRNGIFCVNVLCGTHELISALFAGSPPMAMEDRFKQVRWRSLATGAPTLEEAAVSFDCVITNVSDVGTHSVFFGHVKGLSIGAAREALIYFARSYHRLPHPEGVAAA
jgi:flavin reductase